MATGGSYGQQEVLNAVYDPATNTLKTSGGSGTGTSPSSSSSSSVGGGNNTYSNLSLDFVATPTVGTKNIVLSAFANTVLSSNLSVLNFSNGIVKRISSTGVVDSLPMTSIVWNNGTLTLTLANMTAVFASGDIVAVVVIGPDKAFNEATDTQKSSLETRLDPVNDAVTTYPYGHSATNISTGTTAAPITTVVKSGSGVLRGVVTGDIGSSWQATLYDNTAASGTIISILKPTNAGFIGFEVGFTTGLTIATTGTAAGNLTVIWR